MSPPNDQEPAIASDSEVSRYEDAFLATRRVLDEAIRNLSILKALATDFDSRNELGLEITMLKRKRTKLAAANVAFHSQTATMVPPSAAQVKELSDLADEAVQLTVQRATAAASLKIATKALNKFAEIQSIGGD
ncbi:hypothetical protein [Steroidobacter sp.]|uniref:hypothetical protein n=1 Tax=Steroidobacter sp. TaxID=1978227 RepID=UPI001A5F5818|nr:hypothetical protein [Steroidobacter sp.]MBL8265665.1 hypothetical protein [Steroidobacter sp.]